MAMNEEFELICDEKGERIDRFLSGKRKDLSRSYIQKLIKEGNVNVNGTAVSQNTKVCTGDQIRVSIPEPEVLDVLPEKIPLDILYEDDDILVVKQTERNGRSPLSGTFTAIRWSMLFYITARGSFRVLTEWFVRNCSQD